MPALPPTAEITLNTLLSIVRTYAASVSECGTIDVRFDSSAEMRASSSVRVRQTVREKGLK
jgi:hypothetical protein